MLLVKVFDWFLFVHGYSSNFSPLAFPSEALISSQQHLIITIMTKPSVLKAAIIGLCSRSNKPIASPVLKAFPLLALICFNHVLLQPLLCSLFSHQRIQCHFLFLNITLAQSQAFTGNFISQSIDCLVSTIRHYP